MFQQVILVLIFVAALSYVGWLIYKSFQTKTGCTTGCGKCGAVDFQKIEAELRDKGL